MDDNPQQLATQGVRAGQKRTEFHEHSEALFLTSSFVFDSAARADAASTARLNGQAAAAQTGPMDAHEAIVFDTAARADAAWTARLNGQAAAAQTGPMDVHEAPAFGTAAPADDDESVTGRPEGSGPLRE